MAGHRIFTTLFASIYPHYVAKAERKGHSRAEVDRVITWLTGYDDAKGTFTIQWGKHELSAPVKFGVAAAKDAAGEKK